MSFNPWPWVFSHWCGFSLIFKIIFCSFQCRGLTIPCLNLFLRVFLFCFVLYLDAMVNRIVFLTLFWFVHCKYMEMQLILYPGTLSNSFLAITFCGFLQKCFLYIRSCLLEKRYFYFFLSNLDIRFIYMYLDPRVI